MKGLDIDLRPDGNGAGAPPFRHLILTGPNGSGKSAVDPADVQAGNTASELHYLHTRSRRAGDLRDAIKDHVLDIYRTYKEMRAAEDAGDDALAAQKHARLRRLLGRDAPFTMLARSEFSTLRGLFDES